MPVVYQLDPQKQRIHTRCVGAVTLPEVLHHFTELSQDPACPPRLDVLLDLTETTSLPTSGQLSAVALEIARVSPRVTFRHCAIVVSRDAMFGMARVFEVLAERQFAQTRVVRGLAEAVAWLDREAEATAS